LFGLAPDGAAAQKTAAKSLCAANEQTIWSCATTKNKIASVCASKDLTADKGYLQYRFGLSGKIELEFPQKREGSQKAFKYLRYTRPLVTLLTLSFENNGVIYEIHDDDNSEERPPIRVTSIDVVKDANKTTAVVCKQPTTGSLMKLEDVVPRNEEN
jgi:hypothetical protein